MISSRIISASLSPNAEKEDVLAALRILFQPARWISGSGRQAVETWFAKYFGIKFINGAFLGFHGAQ